MKNDNRTIRSACRMCHGVCQVLVHMEGDRVVRITGDPESPTSSGYLCPKGAASPELLYHKDRILHPLRRAGRRGENKWEKITWDEALDEMAGKLRLIKEESGSEYFGMLQGTGRPYTGFTQRFANAFGTPNMTGVAHVCYIPRVLASMITMGHNIPVCDFYGFGGILPECIIVWGCNITETGASDGMCGGTVQRALKQAKQVIVIDPRGIMPARKSNLWLRIHPGTDGALALAMINVIIVEELYNRNFVEHYTVGFKELARHIVPYTPEWAEGITRIDADTIRKVSRMYAKAASASIQWGNALDMSRCNFQTARAILILMAICGHLDVPGGDAIWVFPEGIKMKSPFADPMFAGNIFLPLNKYRRCVDGTRYPPRNNKAKLFLEDLLLQIIDFIKSPFLAVLEKKFSRKPLSESLKFMNRLKGAKYPLCHIVHPPTFWESIISGEPYRMRALWIMGSNPLVTMTNPEKIRQALELTEYTVISDFFLTPTAQYADLFLPASTWLERDDIMNMHKNWCVLAQQRVAQVGDTKDDRDVMIMLARKLGLKKAFPWEDYSDFLEWQLHDTGLDFSNFCERGIISGSMKYRKYIDNGFPTKTGKFEIFSRSLADQGIEPLPVYREPVSVLEDDGRYPYILIGGVKNRYFFHGEYRQIGSLRKRNPQPLVQLHHETALENGVNEGDWIWIETKKGHVRMQVQIFDGLDPDVICAQHGWWFPEEGPPGYGWEKSNINMLFGEMEYDPDTGSESLKSMRCAIYKV